MMDDDYPLYFDVDGQPGRKRSPAALLEVMTPDGSWLAPADPEHYDAVADRIDSEEFESLVTRFSALYSSTNTANPQNEGLETFSADDWTPEEGPRHGKLWRNRKSGATVYSPTNPGGESESPKREKPKTEEVARPAKADNSGPAKEAKDKARDDIDKSLRSYLDQHQATDRELSKTELRDAVEHVFNDLAKNPQVFAALEGACLTDRCHATGERYTIDLHESKNLSVYLLRWGEGQEAEWHDHGDGQEGAAVSVRIIQGPVENDFLTPDGRVIRQKMDVGRTYVLPNRYIHRVATAGDHTTWSVHAYSGPNGGLSKMNFYKFDEQKNPVLDDAGKPVQVGVWERDVAKHGERWRHHRFVESDDSGIQVFDESGKLVPVEPMSVFDLRTQAWIKKPPREKVKASK